MTDAPRHPRRPRPLGALTRYVVVPLLLLAIGTRLGMFLEHRRAALPAPGEVAAPLIAAASAPAAAGPAEAPPACDLAASFQDNIYPSLMLSFGVAYPEYTRCLTVTVRHVPAAGAAQVRLDSSLFLQPLEVPLTAAGGPQVLSPELPWNFDALRRTAQMQPQTFLATVLVDGRSVAESTLVCTVHSVNEAVSRLYLASSGQWQDTSVCFASFVNEDHPWISGVLQDAIAGGTVRSFTGYQAGPAGVVAQVQAVWDTLAAKGLSYVNVATDSGTSSLVSTQYVRFLDQSVHDQGANCVDASVLFASVLRRIGLRPVLVFRPGHCFAGFYDAAEGGRLVAFETTMLGTAPFAAAAAEGAKELQATLPYVGSPQYSVVDIALCRQEGINPIPYQAALN